MNWKTFVVSYPKSCDRQDDVVQLRGVPPDERLTPRLARQAARVACGHSNGVTVSDGKVAYRLYKNTARKLWLDE